jgi:uncharacterized protein (TIGR02099 family)
MLRNSKFKTFVWYTSVGLLVFFAVAVTLFRLLFTSVAEYREQLEIIAGSYLGQPVTISGIDARVDGLSPSVILRGVSLLHKGGEALLTRFDSVSISLDPVASLRSISPIIELTVSGANLEVTRNLDGTFGVKGLELPGRTKEGQPEQQQEDGGEQNVAEQSQALGAWFLSQSRLAVRDSRITLHNEKTDERFSFDNVELELRNDSERHRLNGFVNLPDSIGRELRVAADIQGNLLQRNDWSGGLYVKTVQLQPRQWLQQYSWQDSSIREGVLDLELWSRWQNGELESVNTRLHAAGLTLARGGDVHVLPGLSANAQLLFQEDGWFLDVGDLQLQHNETPPLPMRLALSRHGDDFSLQVDQLQLEAMAALLPYLPQLDEPSRAMVRQMAPAGEVKGLHLHRAADGQVAVQGEVTGLVLQPWEKLPGVEGLDAQFGFNGDDGQLRLSGENATLTLPRLFRAPLALNQLGASLSLRREPGGWSLFSDSIAAANNDISIQLGLELRLLEGSPPWLSLQGRFSEGDARAVPRYLPAGIMKAGSLHWLDNAFKAGRVPGGTLQFHGFVNHFPFKQHRGRFEVLFDAAAVQLHYQDGWPDLQQVAGEVHFDGAGMWIDARQARIFDAKLGATTVSIDNFHLPRLLIDGKGVFPANDGLRFLRESPLSKNTGKLFDTMQGGGEAALALQLVIPLSPKVRESSPLKVDGKIDFSGNRFDVIDGVSFKQLNGRLHFSDQSFSAKRLTAQLFGRPVSLVVTTEAGEMSPVVVVAHGGGELSAMRDALKLPLLDYLEGSADWEASLRLPRGGAAEGVELHVSSNLLGVSSTLPQPLTKAVEGRRDLRMAFFLSGVRSGEGHLTLGAAFGMIWRGKGENQALRRVRLRLGGDAPLSLPERDMIDVVGTAGSLSLSLWRNVMHKLRGKGEGSRQPLPVVVTMQQLQLLSDSSGEDKVESLKVADLPEITFAVEQFSYDDLQLGKVALKMVPQDNRMSMRDIRIESDVFTLTAKGTWTEGGNTFFNLDLISPDLGRMMKHFGFASVIQGGKTKASGKIWWSGVPTALTLGELNAQLALSIKKGSIVDVEPGAGRMLGILSLPALPKRLLLDFSDVFKEGLVFDNIKGDIRIEQGQAYTSNLQLESVPANILVSGRTGLVAQDFDQELFVAPKVSDTVSVASALAWGPQVAAVVALLQEVFKSDIKAATMSRYHISGSWQEPIIRRITEQDKEKSDFPFSD